MADTPIGGGRAETTCLGCNQTDDHPKCKNILNDGRHTFVHFHMDCHAAATPPCPVCSAVMAAGGAGKTGATLLAHITAEPISTTQEARA